MLRPTQVTPGAGLCLKLTVKQKPTCFFHLKLLLSRGLKFCFVLTPQKKGNKIIIKLFKLNHYAKKGVHSLI